MNDAINKVIHDLENQLTAALRDADWYQTRMKEAEVKIINLKNTLAELESLKLRK